MTGKPTVKNALLSSTSHRGRLSLLHIFFARAETVIRNRCSLVSAREPPLHLETPPHHVPQERKDRRQGTAERQRRKQLILPPMLGMTRHGPFSRMECFFIGLSGGIILGRHLVQTGTPFGATRRTAKRCVTALTGSCGSPWWSSGHPASATANLSGGYLASRRGVAPILLGIPR